MPTVERCLCTIVLAPKFLSENCPTTSTDASVVEREDLWFTEDKELLTNSMKWTPEQLDQLLERAGFCSEYLWSNDGDIHSQITILKVPPLPSNYVSYVVPPRVTMRLLGSGSTVLLTFTEVL